MSASGLPTRQTNFNPRPRAGGDGLLPIIQPFETYFNPRPRAGGDEYDDDVFLELIISIPAPAQGATKP